MVSAFYEQAKKRIQRRISNMSNDTKDTDQINYNGKRSTKARLTLPSELDLSINHYFHCLQGEKPSLGSLAESSNILTSRINKIESELGSKLKEISVNIDRLTKRVEDIQMSK